METEENETSTNTFVQSMIAHGSCWSRGLWRGAWRQRLDPGSGSAQALDRSQHPCPCSNTLGPGAAGGAGTPPGSRLLCKHRALQGPVEPSPELPRLPEQLLFPLQDNAPVVTRMLHVCMGAMADQQL